jgi:hypothetical protein
LAVRLIDDTTIACTDRPHVQTSVSRRSHSQAPRSPAWPSSAAGINQRGLTAIGDMAAGDTDSYEHPVQSRASGVMKIASYTVENSL